MYATIIDRKISLHAGVPTLEKMQEVVGGYITTALRGPAEDGRSVDVYCNDEGLLINLPIDHVRLTDGSPIAGNMVITASDAEGETVAATKAEIVSILPHIGRTKITMEAFDFGF